MCATNSPLRLSKSKLMALHQCPLRLWNEVFKRDKAQPPSPQTQFLFDSGTAIGELAHHLYPAGTLIQAEYWNYDRALQETNDVLADVAAPALFEPAFEYRRTIVRCDLLVRTGGSWELWEVKSVANPKDYHILDVAIQALVMKKAMEGNGQLCDIENMGIVHLNGDYVYDGKTYKVNRLFTKHACLEEALDLEPFVEELITEGLQIIDSPSPPKTTPGDQCCVPYDCPFLGTICQTPEPHELISIPGIGPAKLRKLIDQGIETLDDFAASSLACSGPQKRLLKSLQTGSCVAEPTLASDLASISYPHYHLDFETFAPALPRYAGTRPFQVIPFQFSVHIVHSIDVPAEHAGYLHAEDTDPRVRLAEELLSVLERFPTAPVLMYTSYEKRVLVELALALPEFADRIDAVIERLVDLCAIIKKNIYHPDFNGSFSIKDVLPALVPDLGYDDLEVADGSTASLRYIEMIELAPMDTEAAKVIWEQLWAYCKRDTEAMVAVMRYLLSI